MGYFTFGNEVVARADVLLNNLSARKLWHSFCANGSSISFEEGNGNTFQIGQAQLPELGEGEEYAINVEEGGIAIAAPDYNGLVRGFTSLLRKVEFECLEDGQESLKIECFTEHKRYKLKRRMIHYCVFPETDITTIRREIRYAGVLHYTHVVLEFWGMFPYECLKELSWPNAYSKDAIKDLIREIRELGMEPVPFLNHLGHAPMSRVLTGKHVVLDQNPKLQNYFMEDGWEWNISSEKTKALLRQMRAELCEVYGESEYFHIGCDEAYMISGIEELHGTMVDFVRELTLEIEQEGRKPMIWADMFIAPEEIETKENPVDMAVEGEYYAACKSAEKADELLKILSPNTVLVDWQYNTKKAPLRSYTALLNKGQKVMEAPWYGEPNCRAAVETVEACDGYGLMLTTWHYVNEAFTAAMETSAIFGGPQFKWSEKTKNWVEAATVLRKVSYDDLEYTQTGFCENQIGYTPL